MTQETSLPSPPAEKMEPPQYDNEKSFRFSEKESKTHPPCTHTPSPTPFLDTHLATPAAHSAVYTIHTTLDHLTDGEHCTRCAANEAARTLTRYLFEMRQAKKSEGGKGRSKEEKRAMKVELKGLMREVKGVVREEKAKLKREGSRG